MEKLNLDKRSLKNFGIAMGVAFLVIFGLFFSRHSNSALSVFGISFLFLIVGLVLPNLLKPLYIVWMRLAFILGWVNTRIILIILFYLIFTPLGLFIRLFRIDLLERKKKEGVYWHKKEKVEFNPLNYERRF